jgi:hypothetical protein
MQSEEQLRITSNRWKLFNTETEWKNKILTESRHHHHHHHHHY